MPNYQKSKIYKLYSPSKKLTYIGSTTETLASRLSKHIYSYKAHKQDNTKLYTTAYLVLECEDYKMELVEEYACNNRQQLEKKEGEYIKENECVNYAIAGRTRKEWCEDNKQYVIETRKKYKEEHKAELREKNKIYMKTEKAKEQHKLADKKYRETEKAKEQHKLANKKYCETKKQNNAIYKWLKTTGIVQ